MDLAGSNACTSVIKVLTSGIGCWRWLEYISQLFCPQCYLLAEPKGKLATLHIPTKIQPVTISRDVHVNARADSCTRTRCLCISKVSPRRAILPPYRACQDYQQHPLRYLRQSENAGL